MIPYYFGTPHTGAESFCFHIYAFHWGRRILQEAQPQATFPSSHIKLSSSTDMFSVHSAYFLDGLEIPEVSGYGRVRGTSNSEWLEKKPRGCTVPDSSLQAALQGRACTLPRGRQHAWLLSVCLEYVLESAVERVGFISPCVGSWLMSHLTLRGTSKKNVGCALESACFQKWLQRSNGWLVSVADVQKVNICFEADRSHYQFLTYKLWSRDTSSYPAPRSLSFLPRFPGDLSGLGENCSYERRLPPPKTVEKDRAREIHCY